MNKGERYDSGSENDWGNGGVIDPEGPAGYLGFRDALFRKKKKRAVGAMSSSQSAARGPCCQIPMRIWPLSLMLRFRLRAARCKVWISSARL